MFNLPKQDLRYAMSAVLELRKTFKSFSKMKAWFKEHASKTKGQA